MQCDKLRNFFFNNNGHTCKIIGKDYAIPLTFHIANIIAGEVPGMTRSSTFTSICKYENQSNDNTTRESSHAKIIHRRTKKEEILEIMNNSVHRCHTHFGCKTGVEIILTTDVDFTIDPIFDYFPSQESL